MYRTRAIIIVMLALILAACGTEGASNTAPAGDSNTSGGTVERPGGPDTSVSGQPGDPLGKPTGAVVEGIISDATGKPVAGTVVMPKSVDTPPQAVPEKAVFTDAQGRYQWVLSPGKYTFSVSYNGTVTESNIITVTEEQPNKLDVSLK